MPEEFFVNPVELGEGAKAGGKGDFTDGQAGVTEELAGLFGALAGEKSGQGESGALVEFFAEVSWVHAGEAGTIGESPRAFRVGAHLPEEVIDGGIVVAGVLGQGHGGELGGKNFEEGEGSGVAFSIEAEGFLAGTGAREATFAASGQHTASARFFATG